MRAKLLATATVLLASTLALSACATTSATSGPRVRVTGTVSGTVERVGGPIGPDGSQPTPVPMSATAVLYVRETGQTAISGKPVESVATSSADPGHFTFAIKPGTYFVVARLTDGSLASNPKAITVTRGETTTANLVVAVP